MTVQMKYAIAEVPESAEKEGFVATTAKIAMLRLPCSLFQPSPDASGPIMRTMIHQVQKVSEVMSQPSISNGA